MKKMFDSWGSHVKKIPLQGLLCLFILCLSLPLHAQNEEGKIKFYVNNEPDCILKIYSINDLNNEDYIMAYCGLSDSVELINIEKNTLINFLNNI